MIRDIDLNQFADWAAEKSSRVIKIEIGPTEPDGINIFAYDIALREGQSVKSVGEINLEAKKEQGDRELYKELRKKFEGVPSDEDNQ